MGWGGWERIPIRTEAGEPVEAVAPVIVSASRRTDIPAFHADWFVGRLRAGHVRWVNPFSGQPQHVAFARTRAVVFWSKNPRPLLAHLPALDRGGIGSYVQFTLNDYRAEGLEPGLPPLAERIRTFQELSAMVGRARVVWRFDPLLLAEGLSLEGLVERVTRIGERVHPHTERLVIACADIARYAKVRGRLRRFGGGCRELSGEERREVAARLVRAARGWGLRVSACAEPLDLSGLGIEPSRCVDDRLLARLYPGDADLARFLGAGYGRLRDRGQRAACGCILSKDIGSYTPCPHGCRYCYAAPAEGPG